MQMDWNIYDVVELEDMTFDPVLNVYHYPCPCGDRFEINASDILDNETIAPYGKKNILYTIEMKNFVL
ncbi:Diphthamide biosynthesis protein 3 [Golovinomyces cichoracearum]|uniref:Diphthamide biosynthesis protein 3 n=1 Tax=Golovinomyces cichoracearum TaxID=62708 RepID=A0A420JAB5_9PEZI|nr:Diphthamide biosynthesis protein 3 [Golovinomyces cichoracearum]